MPRRLLRGVADVAPATILPPRGVECGRHGHRPARPALLPLAVPQPPAKAQEAGGAQPAAGSPPSLDARGEPSSFVSASSMRASTPLTQWAISADGLGGPPPGQLTERDRHAPATSLRPYPA